jgi:hypothetical protein
MDHITFYLFYATLILSVVAVLGISLVLAYKLSPLSIKQSINHFFELEGME